MRIPILILATLVTLSAVSTLFAQTSAKYRNEATDQYVLSRLSDIEAVVAGATPEERRELIHRLVYAQVALDDAAGVVDNVESYKTEIPEEQQQQFLYNAARQFGRNGEYMLAWETVDVMSERELKGNSVHSAHDARQQIVRQIVRNEDAQDALERIDSEIVLDDERFGWKHNSKGKRLLFQEIVKKLGRENRIEEAVRLIKQRFEGVDTHDHLLWDLAVSCKRHGIEKSVAVIRLIERPGIAQSAMARMLNRKLEYEEWNVLFQLMREIGGARRALSSFYSAHFENASDAENAWPVFEAVYHEVSEKDRTADDRRKRLKLKLLRGDLDDAVITTKEDLGIDNFAKRLFSTIYAVAEEFGKDAAQDRFSELILFVESEAVSTLLTSVRPEFPNELSMGVYSSYMTKLIQTGRVEQARSLAADYAKAMSSGGRSEHNSAIKTLLELGQPQLAGTVCEVGGRWYLLVDFYLSNQEQDRALDCLDHTIASTGLGVELAVVLAKHGMVDKAIETIRSLPKERQIEGANQTFLLLISKGFAGVAIELIERDVVELTPELEESALMEVCFDNDLPCDPVEALALLNLFQDTEVSNLGLAKLFAKQGDWPGTLRQFESSDDWSKEEWQEIFSSIRKYLEKGVGTNDEKAEVELQVLEYAAQLAETKGWSQPEFVLSISVGNMKYWLNRREDERALALIDVLDDPVYRVEMFAEIAWWLDHRSKGYPRGYVE